jgi:hypothetical protein
LFHEQRPYNQSCCCNRKSRIRHLFFWFEERVFCFALGSNSSPSDSNSKVQQATSRPPLGLGEGKGVEHVGTNDVLAPRHQVGSFVQPERVRFVDGSAGGQALAFECMGARYENRFITHGLFLSCVIDSCFVRYTRIRKSDQETNKLPAVSPCGKHTMLPTRGLIPRASSTCGSDLSWTCAGA